MDTPFVDTLLVLPELDLRAFPGCFRISLQETGPQAAPSLSL